MVLGAVWCPLDKTREVAIRIREIKSRHGLSSGFEIKWTKVSPAKLPFYRDVLDYFFDDDDLHFRAVVVPDKSKLRHSAFGQTHDEWYYKMYFQVITVILDPNSRYRVYLDIKDTQGVSKIAKLQEVLRNNMLDYRRTIIERVQTVRSHEVEQLQLADLLIGAVGYANRQLDSSSAKAELVRRMRQRSTYSLTQSTLLAERKVNVFRWRPREISE